jgi:hypothetical protein
MYITIIKSLAKYELTQQEYKKLTKCGLTTPLENLNDDIFLFGNAVLFYGGKEQCQKIAEFVKKNIPKYIVIVCLEKDRHETVLRHRQYIKDGKEFIMHHFPINSFKGYLKIFKRIFNYSDDEFILLWDKVRLSGPQSIGIYNQDSASVKIQLIEECNNASPRNLFITWRTV